MRTGNQQVLCYRSVVPLFCSLSSERRAQPKLNSSTTTAALADRLEEVLDRHVIIVNDLQELSGEKDQWVVLSAVELTGPLTLAAQSRTQQSWLSKVGVWFNHTIARRKPGDRLEASETYFLYEPRPAIVH